MRGGGGGRREGKGGGGAPPTDLLVCFPSMPKRSHLALMPKPVYSPSRPHTEQSITKRHHHHHHHLGNGSRQASPLLWAKTTKSMASSSEMDEPTSPKVTCAGQIKVRSKTDSCKNWQSVMEEIERLNHQNNNTRRKQYKKKKKPTWVEALGLKKDVMQFLSCLRSIKLDLRCFGSFHPSVVLSSSDDENEEDEEEEEEEEDKVREHQNHDHHHQVEEDGVGDQIEYPEGDGGDDGSGSSKAVFSKWFMVLEEDQNHDKEGIDDNDDEEECLPCAPPPNALLLMRCRSAPAKSWLEEKLQEQQDQEEKEEAKKANLALEEKEKKDNLILKYYAPDFFKVSSDIAKETWVVGGTRDPLSRSRSWKR